MQTQHQAEDEMLYLYFRDALVGVVEEVRFDMWYMEGIWKPQDTAVTAVFEQYLKSINVKEIFKDYRGKLVKWSCQPTDNPKNDGLAMRISNGRMIVRMLVSEDGVDLLRKDHSYL